MWCTDGITNTRKCFQMCKLGVVIFSLSELETDWIHCMFAQTCIRDVGVGKASVLMKPFITVNRKGGFYQIRLVDTKKKIAFHQCKKLTLSSWLSLNVQFCTRGQCWAGPHCFILAQLLTIVTSVLFHCKKRPTDHFDRCGIVCALSVLGQRFPPDLW